MMGDDGCCLFKGSYPPQRWCFLVAMRCNLSHRNHIFTNLPNIYKIHIPRIPTQKCGYLTSPPYKLVLGSSLRMPCFKQILRSLEGLLGNISFGVQARCQGINPLNYKQLWGPSTVPPDVYFCLPRSDRLPHFRGPTSCHKRKRQTDRLLENPSESHGLAENPMVRWRIHEFFTEPVLRQVIIIGGRV